MVNFKLPRGPNTLTAGVSRRALDDEKPTASDRFVSFGDRVRYDDATGARADDATRGFESSEMREKLAASAVFRAGLRV